MGLGELFDLYPLRLVMALGLVISVSRILIHSFTPSLHAFTEQIFIEHE